MLFFIFAVYPNFEMILIDGDSMVPTLTHGQLIILNKHTYKSDHPAVNDIVVIVEHHDNTKIVKRLVAGPGSTISIKDGFLCINGIINDAGPVFNGAGLDKVLCSNIPEFCYFYIGDNRVDSSFGIVGIEQIQGKVMFYE